MNALVASASRHGATREIADLIGATIAERGIATDIREVENALTPDGYDAVVVGSAVYMGDWIKSGPGVRRAPRRRARREAHVALQQRPDRRPAQAGRGHGRQDRRPRHGHPPA